MTVIDVLRQLVNEEEPAQASQEAPTQDAPPPYSSVAAANAGKKPPESSHSLSLSDSEL